MSKGNQMERAKALAVTFLHLPMKETKFSPIVVQHPFFESAFLYDKEGIFNALEDEARHNEYIRRFAENGIGACEDIKSLLSLIRKSYRLVFLLYMRDKKIVSTKEAGDLLAEQWSLIENLSHDANVSKRTVLSWIKMADKTALMDEEELRQYNDLPDIVTVYRGCRVQKAMKGMSWTMSEEKARWFAERLALLSGGKRGTGPMVYRAKIRREDVIGYLAGRDEEEVIVDYRKLFDVELCDKGADADLCECEKGA